MLRMRVKNYQKYMILLPELVGLRSAAVGIVQKK